MQKDFLKQLNSYQQAAYEATKQLADINAHTYEKLIEQQFAVIGSCMERLNKQTQPKDVHETKEVADYLQTQGELVKECAEKSVAAGKETMEILTKARDELADWAEKGLDKAKDYQQAAQGKEEIA